MNWFYRISACLIFPAIVLIIYALYFKDKENRDSFKENYKKLIINLIFIVIIGILVIYLFFKNENKIYAYDYAGHWLRYLNIRKIFYEEPARLFSELYHSLNYDEYTYLPAFFATIFMPFGYSYSYFVITSFLLYLPGIIYLFLISIKDNNYKYCLFLFIAYYPLTFILFNGEIDGIAILFIAYIFNIFFIKKATIKELLTINIVVLYLLFTRRYFLYLVFVFYILYLIKCLIIYFKEKDFKIIIKAFSSGIFALLIIILFFRGYLAQVFTNNFEEAYAFYDHNHKILALINYFSILITLITLIGLFKTIKEKNKTGLYAVISIVLICLLFWHIQSMEPHHYLLLCVPAFYLFSQGITYIDGYSNKISYILFIILALQTTNIYTNFTNNKIKLFTTWTRLPTQQYDVDKLKDYSLYLHELTQGEGISIYLATGDSTTFNDDILRNANLPDLSLMPVIDTAVLDLRDGFPKDLKNILYVITSKPTLYLDENYQHSYDIITNAIEDPDSPVHNIYKLIDQREIDHIKYYLYQRTGEFTPAIKEYFYNRILSYYPDKAQFFAYILD